MNSKKELCKHGDQLPSKVMFRQTRTEVNSKTKENSVCVANKQSGSAPRSSYLKDLGGQCPDLVYVGFGNRMETTLIKVESTVHASYQANHDPLVSLVSGLNGKGIVGQLMDVEALDDSYSETKFPRKCKSGRNMFNNQRNTMPQLPRRTARMTPIQYLLETHRPSIMKNEKIARACKYTGSSPQAQEFLTQKKHASCNQNKRAPTLLDSDHKRKGNKMDVLPLAEDILRTRISVPVNLIFSKLLIAAGKMQS